MLCFWWIKIINVAAADSDDDDNDVDCGFAFPLCYNCRDIVNHDGIKV